MRTVPVRCEPKRNKPNTLSGRRGCIWFIVACRTFIQLMAGHYQLSSKPKFRRLDQLYLI
jgi:hypothetical protein